LGELVADQGKSLGMDYLVASHKSAPVWKKD
jgi:hypothetical protein